MSVQSAFLYQRQSLAQQFRGTIDDDAGEKSGRFGATMTDSATEQQLVTRLLKEWSSGNKAALDELMPVVYQQLRKLASICLRSERPDHTLRATALVHEAYLRLVGAEVAWQDRVHFFAVSARLLRRILVDHARTNRRQKRGGGVETIALDEAIMIGPQTSGGMLELDMALQRLAGRDQRKSDIVELICFGGLTYDEAAAALNVSPVTIHRELKMAKAFLHRELTEGPSST
jgi:RNA polymerase sigma factor (TIGR02999 family)